MKWQGRRGSSNVEDRRGARSSRGSGMAVGGGGIGLLAVVVIGYFLGIDLTPILGGQGGEVQSGTGEITEADRQAGEFVSVVLADTEEVWADIFQQQLNQPYTPATLVLFSGSTQSACGGASAASGPFYCPVDQKVYLDTDFFAVMQSQLGAGGDFAQAYVVAHEIGHHVQGLLGILEQTQRGDTAGAEGLSVRTELQADCFSGVWANRAQARFGSIERGDIAEAMNAAAQIGDDTLQREQGGRVRPDSFTHGSSEQRQRWFNTGFETGDVGSCDTFSARDL